MDERKSNANSQNGGDAFDRSARTAKDSNRGSGDAFDKSARSARESNRGSGDSFDKPSRLRGGGDRSSGRFAHKSGRVRDAYSKEGQDVPRKTRFDNEGVRAYGDNTGFFSKGTRSKRVGDKPSFGERSSFGDKPLFQRSARPTPEGEENSADAFDRSARPARNGDRSSTSDRSSRSGQQDTASPFNRGGRGEERSSPNRSSRPFGSDRVQHDDVPVAIPYSSAASQWLYGVNTVVAALRGNTRKLYQLIVKKGSESPDLEQILKLARRADIKIQTHDDTRLLDKLSEGRPHNGAVLEASALPARPTVSLGKPDSESNSVPLGLLKQNAEDVAINGNSTALQFDSKSWRQPFVLFLDGITDPGNLGGILRTAHFYGVDAVAVATNTCANLNSPVLAKASAGACEAIPILTVSKPAEFIYKSGHAGWKICAAVAPDPRSQKLNKQVTSASVSVQSPLASKPCILMMGSEGEGLRENLRSKADLEVTIQRGAPSKTSLDVGVDSMNVSVATGVLVDAFTREPLKDAKPAADNSADRLF